MSGNPFSLHSLGEKDESFCPFATAGLVSACLNVESSVSLLFTVVTYGGLVSIYLLSLGLSLLLLTVLLPSVRVCVCWSGYNIYLTTRQSGFPLRKMLHAFVRGDTSDPIVLSHHYLPSQHFVCFHELCTCGCC